MSPVETISEYKLIRYTRRIVLELTAVSMLSICIPPRMTIFEIANHYQKRENQHYSKASPMPSTF